MTETKTKAESFLEEFIGYRPSSAHWYKKVDRFHSLSMEELDALSTLSSVSIIELINNYGFGRNTVTLDEMDQLLIEEGEGYRQGIIAHQV